MKIKSIIVYIFISISLFTGCAKDEFVATLNDIQSIKIELIEKVELKDGVSYSIKLINESEFNLKQNNVYLSYPIKTERGSSGNEFKVEATGNRTNIEPNEQIILNLFTPFEGMSDPNLLIETPYIEINGYFDEVDDKNLFTSIFPLKEE
ncbi:hypothetical protein [Chengkuizengella axinellae]|uniref:Lipoprotein n=1 Tax=Chengkuizengella axinellae TaxID=3064388 RepID=A0ABT9J036_9BACL|nr:hypothetical protein [Chengkuizengella sp. 2205SS18-9]MDP5274976.1 hypothetical protein [Chengkuizengella sp. 2205SS18-9]